MDLLETQQFSNDQKWKLCHEIFCIISCLASKKLHFKFIDLNRVFFQNNHLIYNCLQFMQFEEKLEVDMNESLNHAQLSTFNKPNQLAMMLPEIFNGRKIMPNSSTWLLGTFIYFIFEVYLKGKNANKQKIGG